MKRRPSGVELLFLYHLWACMPFAMAWMVWPEQLGNLPASDPRVVGLRIVYLVALVYLGSRTWLTFRATARLALERVWPFLDVVLISIGLYVYRAPGDSWSVLLYLLPVIQSAATCDLRWGLIVGGTAAIGYLCATGQAGVAWLGSTAGQFRPFVIVLMASLFTHLAREVARARRELALADYRAELAAEMHDGLQHYLVGIVMRLELAARMVDKDARQAALLAIDQQYLARQASDELRVLVRRMRSPNVETEGLAELVSQYVEVVGQRIDAGLAIEVLGHPRRLPIATEHAVLRIVQEAVTNALKHAGAGSIEVLLDFGPSAVECRVRDDGRGFDPRRAAGGGFGLETMRERAESCGATFELDAAPGRGTTVLVRIPCGPPEQD